MNRFRRIPGFFWRPKPRFFTLLGLTALFAALFAATQGRPALVFFILTVLSAFGALWSARALLPPKGWFRRLAERIAGFLLRAAASATAAFRKTGGTFVLKDNDDSRSYFFDPVGGFVRSVRGHARRTKWRDLRTNRARVRYIYLHFVYNQIRRGFAFNPGDTPEEVGGALLEESDGAAGDVRALFPLYDRARYGGDISVSDGEVQNAEPLLSRKLRFGKQAGAGNTSPRR